MRAIAAIAMLVAGGASAATRTDLDDRTLAAGCAGCHGPEGRPPAGSPIPGLAGMDAARFRDTMRAFRDGTRDGTLMPQLAKGFSDAQVDRLARYFAAQAREPRRP